MADERASGQEVILRGPVRAVQAQAGQSLAPGPRGPPEIRRGLTELNNPPAEVPAARRDSP